MSPYRIIQIIFYTIWIILFTGWLLWDWSVWYYILAIAAYFLVVAYGSYNMRQDFYLTAFHNGSRDEPKVAITFDDGPSAETTPVILEILKRYKAKATFFCIGKNIPENEALLQKIDAEGHVIGNHSYSHTPFFDVSRTKNVMVELQKTSDVIFHSIGKRTRIFRPPFGVTNPPIARAASKLGLKVIGWDIRSYDTMNKPPEVVVNTVLPKLKNGSVVLLHDNRKATPLVLERILQHTQSRNLQCVHIGELLDIECYE